MQLSAAAEGESLDALAARGRDAAGDPAAAVALARAIASDVPLPGTGRTLDRWEALATLGAVDLTVARTAEPHLDALAIVAEAGDGVSSAPPSATWGVYAAEGSGVRLTARPDRDRHGTWLVDGVKPWCSLAGTVDHALVTAWVDDVRRGLFAVALDQPGVDVLAEAWVSHGLRGVPSPTTAFRDVPVTPVGAPGWYLERDGFAWGGIGVAAVWFGGAVGLARRLRQQIHERDLDQIGWMHFGAVDRALYAARATLAESATLIDRGRATGSRGAVLALRVRGVVADTVETVLRTVDHALGPAPLVREEEHATRVSDLRVYVRQHHAERDAAALGAAVGGPDAGREPW